jgi:hypothetical protein
VHVDPNNTWRRVEERLKTEREPKRRRNLETVLAHMRAEAFGDLDGLMVTITRKRTPSYHAYASPDALMSPQSVDAVRQFYAAFVMSGAVKLELDVDRLVVDEDAVVTEGVMKIAYPGKLLRLLGREVDDPEAFYLFATRMCIVWPMDEDGLVIGEDSYSAGDGFEGIEQRKLAAGALGAAKR